MRIALIGNGNLAWHLSTAFRHHGSRIDLHFVRKEGEQSLWKTTNQIADINDTYHLVLLAVPDSQIAEVSAQLPEKVRVVHFSGATALHAIRQENRAVCWPCQTLTKGTTIDYSKIPVLFESSTSEMQTYVDVVLKPVLGQWTASTSEQRAKAHLAATFSNNFTNHMQVISQELLKEANLPADLFYSMLKAHIELLAHHDPRKVQTGPAKRNDEKTLRTHEELLLNHPEWKMIYERISKDIQNTHNPHEL